MWLSLTHPQLLVFSVFRAAEQKKGWAETAIFDFLFIVVLQREMVQCIPNWLKDVKRCLYKKLHTSSRGLNRCPAKTKGKI